MRKHVISELINLAEKDSRIDLLVGDLGYSVVEKFAEKFPTRFINCGIAEENMMSIASGMALEGDIVFVYSIGNFPSLRCLEQIRNDVCYHKANVNIISVGGGFSYGSMGMSHHTTEELAILRTLPEMRVYAPADCYEALAVLRKVIDNPFPSYMRLARGTDKVFHSAQDAINIDKMIPFIHSNKEHYNVTIVSTGTILEEALIASDIINNSGFSSRVFSCPSIKPIDSEGIMQISNSSDYIISVEEHNIIAGLGGAISEVLSEYHEHAPLIRFGLKDVYSCVVGSREYLRSYYGIDGKTIAEEVLKRLTKQCV